MGDYREATNAGKAAQRGIVDQRERPQRSKKSRPIVVECRRCDSPPGVWGKWGNYIDTKAAEQTIAAKQRHSYYSRVYEFRIRPETPTPKATP